jgi:hypothetical protein
VAQLSRHSGRVTYLEQLGGADEVNWSLKVGGSGNLCKGFAISWAYQVLRERSLAESVKYSSLMESDTVAVQRPICTGSSCVERVLKTAGEIL